MYVSLDCLAWSKNFSTDFRGIMNERGEVLVADVLKNFGLNPALVCLGHSKFCPLTLAGIACDFVESIFPIHQEPDYLGYMAEFRSFISRAKGDIGVLEREYNSMPDSVLYRIGCDLLNRREGLDSYLEKDLASAMSTICSLLCDIVANRKFLQKTSVRHSIARGLIDSAHYARQIAGYSFSIEKNEWHGFTKTMRLAREAEGAKQVAIVYGFLDSLKGVKK